MGSRLLNGERTWKEKRAERETMDMAVVVISLRCFLLYQAIVISNVSSKSSDCCLVSNNNGRVQKKGTNFLLRNSQVESNNKKINKISDEQLTPNSNIWGLVINMARETNADLSDPKPLLMRKISIDESNQSTSPE